MSCYELGMNVAIHSADVLLCFSPLCIVCSRLQQYS